MRRLASDATYVAASHGASAASLLIAQILLARTLPQATYGAVVLMQSLVNLVEALFLARAGEVALYWIGRTWGDDSVLARGYAASLARNELLWNGGVYLFALALAWPAHLVFAIDPVLLGMFALTIPLQASFGVSKSVFISSGKIAFQSKCEIGYCAVYLALVIPLTLLFKEAGFVCASVVAAGAKTLVWWWLAKGLWAPSSAGAARVSPPSTGVSVHSLIRNACVNIAQQGDTLILGVIASKETVAIYKIARTLANLPAKVAGPVWSVLRPRVLDALRANDAVRVRRLFVVPGAWLALLCAPCVFILWLCAEPLLSAVYGASYAAAALPLVALFAGTWLHGAATGWLPFAAVMAKRKIGFTKLYVLLAVAIIAGTLLAGDSALNIAIAASGSMILVSALAWRTLLGRAFLREMNG